MIEEIQKRPFVRPLFLWITGILCYAFLPTSLLLYVLGVLSALVFLFLVGARACGVAIRFPLDMGSYSLCFDCMFGG